MALIELDNLTLERGSKLLFERIDLAVHEGDKTVIVGPSGSGKTSILMAIMGTFAPIAGRIIYNGKAVASKNIEAVRSAIAFISQEPVLGAKRVEDALLLPFGFRSNRATKPSSEEIAATLQRLHLSPSIIGKPSLKISAGEKQRIAIARALLLGKRVFLVDEATSALDPESKAAVAEILEEPDYTILSVSHDQYWIDRCTRVLRVDNRRLREEVRT